MYAFPSRTWLAVVALFAASASADPAPAALVKDLLTESVDGGRVNAYQRHTFGDVAYFTVETNTTGPELWSSDGTPGGTALIRDVWPGVGGDAFSNSGLVREAGQPLLTTLSDGVHGFELWKTDGTATGTTMVKDVLPGGDDGHPRELVVIGATHYFAGFDHEHGLELWKSDGTEAGTALVKDISPGPNWSVPELLTTSGSTLFFYADDGVHGHELWKSDGTAAGTVMVLDVRPGSEGSENPIGFEDRYLRAWGSGVLFGANDGGAGYELWTTDGTAAGTVLVKDFKPGPDGGGPSNTWPHLDGLLDGKVWFAAHDDVPYNQQFWSSDGTTAGTTQLAEITPFFETTGPGKLATAAGTGFFIMNSMSSGMGLWKTDGSAAGTVLVHDFFATFEEDYCAVYNMGTPSPTPAVGLVFYLIVDCFDGSGVMWRSDGTPAGTFPIAENAGPLVALDDALLFGKDNELWRTDGTLAGTAKVKDFVTQSSSPAGAAEMGGNLYFVAQGPGTTGRELWKSDGTAAGTQMLIDLSQPGMGHSGSSDPEQLSVVGNTLFFTANTGANDGRELWKSDGTAAGTVRVKDIGAGWISGIELGSPLVVANGLLFFAATNNSLGGFELWKSDGTAAGTVLVKDIWGGSSGSHPRWITNLNGTLYFAASDGTPGPFGNSGAELWKSDGTAVGTVRVKDIWPGSGSGAPSHLVVHDGLLYFAANDGISGAELWRSDGTDAGTFAVKDIQPGAEGSKPEELISANGALFFRASTAANGAELWRSNGAVAGTSLVRDIVPGPQSSTPTSLRALTGRVAFQADDGVHGLELWTSDGSEAGTSAIDIRPGSASSLVPSAAAPARSFTTLEGRLVFAANDGLNGEALWASDGTAVGTRLASNVAAPGGSQLGEIFAGSGTIYFSANQAGPGQELFAVSRAGLLFDSDGDGLDDDAEAQHGTNPLVADTDGDGFSDGDEVLVQGSDPLDPLDPGEGEPPEVPALGPLAGTALAALLILAGTIGSASRLRRRNRCRRSTG